MPPNRLFHYQPFKEEYLASLLLDRKVKLSRPNKVNDPWDCRVHYQVPTDSVGRERVIKAFRELHRTTYPAQGEAERDKLVELNQEAAFSNMEKYMYDAHCKHIVSIVFQRNLTCLFCGRTMLTRIQEFA
jgi:hypothetical protein